MNKAESLLKLKAWSFNTPEFKIYQPGRYFTELPTTKYERFGIRTFLPSGKGFSMPFLRNVASRDVPDHVDRLCRQGYGVIVSSWYPADWSIVNAHVEMQDEERGCVEYLEGKGIGRDLMTTKTLESFEFNSLRDGGMEWVTVLSECKDIFIFNDKHPCIIECTLMDRDVGLQDEPIVFWEIRDA